MAQNQKQETQAPQAEPVTSKDVAVIVAKPEQYGFRWALHVLHTDNGATRLRDADTAPAIFDLAKLRAAFTDARVLAWLQGASSVKVQSDTVCRKLREKNATVSEQEQRENVVRRVLLGEAAARSVKTVTVEVVKYAAMDGRQYDSLLDAQRASIAVMVDMGLTLNEAKQRLGIATD